MQRLTASGEQPPAGGTTQAADDLAPAERPRAALDLRDLGGRYALLVALGLMVLVFSLLRPDTFFTAGNFESILTTESVLIVLALGVTVALAAGEFDLSVASVVGFSAGLLAHLTANEGVSPGVALLITFLAALAVGVANGTFVVYFGVNSFITTLGVGSVVAGLALAIFGAETIGGVPTSLTDWAGTELFGLALPVYFALLVALLLWFFLEHTPSGRYLFFTGEGREAARLAGVRVNRIRFLALVTAALMAWLAGVVLVGQTAAAQATYGQPFLLPAFAAGFLGATTIKPGRYNAWGTVIAVFLLAVGTTGLQLLGAADWVEDVFNGAALVLAVTLARLVSREE